MKNRSTYHQRAEENSCLKLKNEYMKGSNDPLDIETIRKHFGKLAGEEKNLEHFTSQALQLVGEHTGACSMIISIRDSEQDSGVIFASQSKHHNGWQFEILDDGEFNQFQAVQDSQEDDFSNYPFFSFYLDLPSRWLGVLQVEYPSIDPYSLEYHKTLKGIVNDLSYGLHIALLNQRQRNLQKRLQKETELKHNYIELSMAQNKKIKALKHHVDIKNHNIHEKEKKKSVLKQDSQPLSSSNKDQSVFTRQILKEIDYSRKMVLLGELASGVAHQIRNPLNNFLGAIHLIKDVETSDEEREELLGSLTERVETINQMISEFIYYTRITKLNRTPEDINTVLKNSLNSFKSLVDLSAMELKVQFDSTLPKITLDLYLMNQVFHNIIQNALDAMNNNGQLSISLQRLTIKHGPKPRLEFIAISFQDTGPGIPKKDIKKVLNPFYSKKNDGMGLGLSVVKHVVRVHGGAVRIKSQEGLFTNITIYLPLR